MGTKYKGTPEEVRALSAFINLVRAADSVTARTAGRLQASGLTPSQFGVLETLLHCGAMCQCDMASKLLRTGASVTSVLDVLEKRGLVERRRSTEDRRFVRVGLTAAGRRLIEKVFPEHARAIAGQFRALSPAEQEQLRVLCRKLGTGKR